MSLAPCPLLTVDDIVKRWAHFGATRKLVWRLRRRGVLRATRLRKRGMLFHVDQVIAAEKSIL